MMLTELANVLRGAGLTVVEVSGWQSRTNDGNRFAGVQGILCHWTGTALSAQGSYPSLNIVTYGRSDLPGMLAQLGLGRDGVWYVIGAGVAWHAGAVDQSYSDNYHAIGIEAEYHPDQGAWPDAQQRSYERGCAALAAHYGVPNERLRGHYEAAIPYGRKPDPNTLPGGMPGFRQRVAAVNLTVNLEDDVSTTVSQIQLPLTKPGETLWGELVCPYVGGSESVPANTGGAWARLLCPHEPTTVHGAYFQFAGGKSRPAFPIGEVPARLGNDQYAIYELPVGAIGFAIEYQAEEVSEADGEKKHGVPITMMLETTTRRTDGKKSPQ